MPKVVVEVQTERMQQYTLVLMKRTAKWKVDAVGFNFVVKEYPAFAEEMTARGYVAIAGLIPLAVPGELRAVTIFRVGPEQTARLLKDDPSVREACLSLKSIRGHPAQEYSPPDSRCSNHLLLPPA